jgi:hypothetical protein
MHVLDAALAGVDGPSTVVAGHVDRIVCEAPLHGR